MNSLNKDILILDIDTQSFTMTTRFDYNKVYYKMIDENMCDRGFKYVKGYNYTPNNKLNFTNVHNIFKCIHQFRSKKD